MDLLDAGNVLFMLLGTGAAILLAYAVIRFKSGTALMLFFPLIIFPAAEDVAMYYFGQHKPFFPYLLLNVTFRNVIPLLRHICAFGAAYFLVVLLRQRASQSTK